MRLLIIIVLFAVAVVAMTRPELYTLAAAIVPDFMVNPALLAVYTLWVFAAAWTPQRQVVARVDLASLQPKDIEQIATAVAFVGDIPVRDVGANLTAISELKTKIEAAAHSTKSIIQAANAWRSQIKTLDDNLDMDALAENIEETVKSLERISKLDTDNLPNIEEVIDTITSQVEKVRELVGSEGDELDEFSDDIDKVLEAKSKLDELFERARS